MAQSTYHAHAVVLRKTKLAESDLIVTLLSEDGSQLRAVAKGARKPQSSFASRLELYSCVDLLLARGRSLDIVKEVRLIEGNEALRTSLEQAACAACGAELLSKLSQPSLPNDRFFPLACTAFSALAKATVSCATAMCVAFLLKVFAFSGLRPQFVRCVSCGRTLEQAQGALCEAQTRLRFSCEEGGMLCGACAQAGGAYAIQAEELMWAESLLMSTFAQIAEMEVPLVLSRALLQTCQKWTQQHVGSSLKSINFLLGCLQSADPQSDVPQSAGTQSGGLPSGENV